MRLKIFLICLSIIILDLVVFFIFGLLLMNYEDFYDGTKGKLWSLDSMNTNEKIVYICYNIWIILNEIALVFVAYKIYRYIRFRKAGNADATPIARIK